MRHLFWHHEAKAIIQIPGNRPLGQMADGFGIIHQMEYTRTNQEQSN